MNLRECFNETTLNDKLMSYLESHGFGIIDSKTVQAFCRAAFVLGYDCKNNPESVMQVVTHDCANLFNSESDGIGPDLSDPFITRTFPTLRGMMDFMDEFVPGPWDVILDRGFGNAVKMRVYNLTFMTQSKMFMYTRVTIVSTVAGVRCPLRWDRDSEEMLVQGELFS